MNTGTETGVVAAFDFDGTITRRDTLLAFLNFIAGPVRLVGSALPLLPTLSGYAAGLVSNSVAKERVFHRFLHGLPASRYEVLAERFAADRLPQMVRPEALARLAWHKQQGHRCVVISASLEDYVAPWARMVGFDAVLATGLRRLADGRVEGRYAGSNCYGAEKVRRLLEWWGEKPAVLYAYGDSRGDRELLAVADHAYYRCMPGGSDEH
ncbi:MAG: HAD-IB family hydrolase [Pseudomonadota bacterium]